MLELLLDVAGMHLGFLWHRVTHLLLPWWNMPVYATHWRWPQ